MFLFKIKFQKLKLTYCTGVLEPHTKATFVLGLQTRQMKRGNYYELNDFL